MSNLANSVNLKMLEGGYRIKRGDKASLFRFLLLDERKEKITNIEGVKATVILKKDDEHIYKTTSKVLDGTVDFTIKELLEQGDYILEIHTGGYVFPSSNAIRISVVRSLVDIEDEPQMSFEEKRKKYEEELGKYGEIESLYTYVNPSRAEALSGMVGNFSTEYEYTEEELDFMMAGFERLKSLEKTPKPITSISETYSDYGSGEITLSVYRAEVSPEEIQWEIVSQTINAEIAPEEEPLVEFIGSTTGLSVRVKKYYYDFDMSKSRRATIRVTYRDEVAEKEFYG